MPTADDLTGFGFPGEVGELLGGNPVTTAGVGTTQVGAALIKSKDMELTAAGGATAFILSAQAKVNTQHYLFNSTATTAVVFVPVGHTLNGTLNASLSVAQNKGAVMWQYKRNFWASILTA